ncbi:hypothetical protein T03_2761 [Trichinella britovi]|uniref:Uncharacterized protein n=1 Tax=Trichinella britovi TaxID=45882 RepID=A0A0V1AJ75_TRIBR|nr:hypothetical protein T03_2761 [Trichinella britovi]
MRFLDRSLRKADDPLSLATEVVIDDTTITQLKIQGFSIQFFLGQKLLFQLYPKRVWDNQEGSLPDVPFSEPVMEVAV